MRIFLVGGAHEASRVCAEVLLARGHEVAVLAETAEAQRLYRPLAVDLVAGSLFRLSTIEKGLARQDAAVLFGIDMPLMLLPRKADLAPFDRRRREGTRNLVAAALRQRVPLLVVISSVVVYGDHGARMVDERAPLNPPPPAQSFADMEDIVMQGREFQGLRAVILRAGMVYSAHCWHTRSLFSLLKAGQIPPLAGEGSYASPVHAEDLAEAIACSAERAPAGSTLNIVDDEPIRLRDLLREAATGMGVKGPGALPSFLLRLYLGKDLYRLLQTSCRARNDRARALLGWTPRYPSVAERLTEEIAIWRERYLDTALEDGPFQGRKPSASPDRHPMERHGGTAAERVAAKRNHGAS